MRSATRARSSLPSRPHSEPLEVSRTVGYLPRHAFVGQYQLSNRIDAQDSRHSPDPRRKICAADRDVRIDVWRYLDHAAPSDSRRLCNANEP
jgi:hypothetical protein